MDGCNKLLQCFSHGVRQLEQLTAQLKPQVHRLWINSHRDHDIYRAFDATLGIFADQQGGFRGALEGMLSAWQYSNRDWILFVPCDIYCLPDRVLVDFMQAVVMQDKLAAYAMINQQPVYPLCLLHRRTAQLIEQYLHEDQRSLRGFFKILGACPVDFNLPHIPVHSVNAWSELSVHSSA